MEGRAETVKVTSGQVIEQANHSVHFWYVILDGEVMQHNGFARVRLEKDSVIGIGEDGVYICSYTAVTDATLLKFPYNDGEGVALFLKNEGKYMRTVLRAALLQRQVLIKTYSGFYNLATQFHDFLVRQYREYEDFCEKYRTEATYFPRMEQYEDFDANDIVKRWIVDNSAALSGDYLDEYLELMQRNDVICAGAVLETSNQARKIVKRLVEIVNYIKENRDVLLAEDENDLFHLYFELLLDVTKNGHVTKPLLDHMEGMAELIQKLGIYSSELVSKRVDKFHNYEESLAAREEEHKGDEAEDEEHGDGEKKLKDDCLRHILTYAGMDEREIENVRKLLRSYQSIPDSQETDDQARTLRRDLSNIYYEAYYNSFMHAVRYPGTVTVIVGMFLNFGFLDAHMAGDENANILYDLTERIDECNSDNVYTIFEWLKSIYEGKNEPSKNDFDLDYPAYLADMRKNGDITEEQRQSYLNNRDMKIKYDIQNINTS
jgi:hypothetical protein